MLASSRTRERVQERKNCAVIFFILSDPHSHTTLPHNTALHTVIWLYERVGRTEVDTRGHQLGGTHRRVGHCTQRVSAGRSITHIRGDFSFAESNNKKLTSFTHQHNSLMNRRPVSLYVLPWLRSLWPRTCSMIWFLISAFRSVMVAECDRLVSRKEKGQESPM